MFSGWESPLDIRNSSSLLYQISSRSTRSFAKIYRTKCDVKPMVPDFGFMLNKAGQGVWFRWVMRRRPKTCRWSG